MQMKTQLWNGTSGWISFKLPQWQNIRYPSRSSRQVTEQSPRVRALTGDLDEDPANKKILSVLYLSLGGAARKQFRDKVPHTTLWDLKAGEMLNLCTECFQKKRKRTLDRNRFFSRYQQPGESLYLYWHALNELAAQCDFGEITTTLVQCSFCTGTIKKYTKNFAPSTKNRNKP